MASRRLDTYFYGLGLEGPGLGFGLKTCIDIGLEGLRVKVWP